MKEIARYMIGEIVIVDREKNKEKTCGGFDTNSIWLIENEFNKIMEWLNHNSTTERSE